MHNEISFGYYSVLWVCQFARMFADYFDATPDMQRSIEDAFIKFYGINPKAATADDEINTRPQLVKTLMEISTEYSNILRYDPEAINKFKSFVCFDKSCFKESFGLATDINRKTLLYAQSILERNHRMLGVDDDGFPKSRDIYRSTFYEHFANSFYACTKTFVLVENAQMLPSRSIIRQCYKNSLSTNGMHIFKAKDVLELMLNGSDILSQKARLFCY